MRVRVTVRCYAELNEFLPPGRRQLPFDAECEAGTSVKDLLEGFGVPHTEIDLVLVNGQPAAFDHQVAAADRVTAYPVFECFDVSGVTRVRPEPLRDPRFVLDGHLGRLAALLRLAGFDTRYDRNASDAALADVSAADHRVLLTRDQGLLKRRLVTHGSYVHATNPAEQLGEVVRRFHLERLARPFTRCTRCNGRLAPASGEAIAARVPPRSRALFDDFLECGDCGRVYWQGSHYQRLRRVLADVL